MASSKTTTTRTQSEGRAKVKPTAKRVGKAKILTERDQQILNFVGQNGVASLDQLHRKFWPQGKERTAQERLGQLVNAGYLMADRTDVRQRDGELIYGLQRAGAAQLGSQLDKHRLIIGLPAHHEMKQQLLAQDTRIALEQDLERRGLRLVEWVNERQLRSEARKSQLARDGGHYNHKLSFDDLADARVMVENAEGETAQIEIEIDGQYYGKMLREKIAQFGKQGKPVIWATTGAGRATRIRNEVQQAGAANITVVQVG